MTHFLLPAWQHTRQDNLSPSIGHSQAKVKTNMVAHLTAEKGRKADSRSVSQADRTDGPTLKLQMSVTPSSLMYGATRRGRLDGIGSGVQSYTALIEGIWWAVVVVWTPSALPLRWLIKNNYLCNSADTVGSGDTLEELGCLSRLFINDRSKSAVDQGHILGNHVKSKRGR